LLQPDAEGKTPLAIAFENSNTDFIASVLERGACDDLDFDGLFFSKNAKVDSICTYLSPQALD
jgi:ankyrin repeat protein